MSVDLDKLNDELKDLNLSTDLAFYLGHPHLYVHDCVGYIFEGTSSFYRSKYPADDMERWRARILNDFYQENMSIKLEGIEKVVDLMAYNSLFNYLEKKMSFQGITFHLFFSPESGESFDLHSDDVAVYLYLLAGEKKLRIEMEQGGSLQSLKLTEGEGTLIQKGYLHQVFPHKVKTVALSIGHNHLGRGVYEGMEI